MFSGCMVIIVQMNFLKNFSIAKIFPSKFPGIFTNIFQRKIIPAYSTESVEYDLEGEEFDSGSIPISTCLRFIGFVRVNVLLEWH